MTIREIDNGNTTKANTTRGSVYTIHTNEYIEYLPNKPTTTSMSDSKYDNTHSQAVAVEFSRSREHEPCTLRTLCRFKVHIQNDNTKRAALSSNSVSLVFENRPCEDLI